RLVEVDALLAEPEIANDMNRYRKMSRERSDLEPVVTVFAAYTATEDDIKAAQDMMSDPEMRDMAEEEFKLGQDRLEALGADLQVLLLPRDPDDGRSVFLEIRAGTGGDESALFAGD